VVILEVVIDKDLQEELHMQVVLYRVDKIPNQILLTIQVDLLIIQKDMM
jgi:hypothetical protein